MKISIITVVKNAERTIEDTILSVVNQTYKNIELIIIDGVSTDGTLDIINKYKDKISYFISEPDTGVYNAMNKGIKAATGDIFYFLNANDSLYDDKVLEEVIKRFKSTNAMIVFGDVFSTIKPDMKQDEYNLANKITKYDFIDNVFSFYYRNLCHQVIFYKKEVFDRIGLYNENYKILADYEFNLRAFVEYKLKCSYINRIIANFELGGLSSIKTENLEKIRLEEMDEIIINSAAQKTFELYKKYYLFMSKYCRTILRFYDSNAKFNRIFNKVIAYLIKGNLNIV